jgi:flagellar hook-associated protein 1 FlgK
MSLGQALNAAVSGLRVSQAGLSLVAGNVANASTPGYTKKTITPIATAANGVGLGVRAVEVQRTLDQFVQRQLRVENAGASYAGLRSQFYDRLQSIFGAPGADGSLETTFNSFTSAVQALSTSPDDPSSRSAAISAAQTLAQQLNDMSDSVQSLRGDAEMALSDAVSQANEAMQQIAKINQQLATAAPADATTATLLDQRDSYIDQLSRLMDINVVAGDNNQVSVLTNSGVQLVGLGAAKLSFDPQGTMNANAPWSADPAQRSVGTLTLVSQSGGAIDLVQTKAIRSGNIAALLQMRAQDLVQAQDQLDAIAAAMAQTLSNKTTAGTPASAGAQTGFAVDIGGLQSGNNVTIDYTDTVTGLAHRLTLVRVDDPAALPLPAQGNGGAVVGIDFSQGLAAALAQVNDALSGTGLTAANPSGTTLQILNGGTGNAATVNGVTATATVTSLTGGVELPLFDDSGKPFTGALTGSGSQTTGFAGRISVNAALVADPSKLVLYQAGVANGDGTRPDYIYSRLVDGSLAFPSSTGIGTATAPFVGQIGTFLRQVISVQGNAAASASSLKQGQDIVLNSLQQRFDESSGVNVDAEMANLLTLQNSYAANARVMSAIKDMIDTLLRM